MHFLHFVLEGPDKKHLQNRYLLRWSAPIFGTEREDRQVLDSSLNAVFRQIPEGIDAAFMARYSRQHSFACPPAITIHDHGNMPRYRPGVRYLSR